MLVSSYQFLWLVAYLNSFTWLEAGDVPYRTPGSLGEAKNYSLIRDIHAMTDRPADYLTLSHTIKSFNRLSFKNLDGLIPNACIIIL